MGMSLSARRAWIEIHKGATLSVWAFVALRKESVDRNGVVDCSKSSVEEVALRKESVDRNVHHVCQSSRCGVALRKESVDRNPPMCTIKQMLLTSLSARRAWIEMSFICPIRLRLTVALRKESVDRNEKSRCA